MSSIIDVVKNLIGNYYGQQMIQSSNYLFGGDLYYNYEQECLTEPGERLMQEIVANLNKDVITIDYEIAHNFEGLCNIYINLGYRLKNSVVEISNEVSHCSGILVRRRDDE